MDTNHFFKYIPKKHVDIIGPAYINNYILKYRLIKTISLRTGVANIEYRKGSKTYGVVYYIKESADLRKLHKKEGYTPIDRDNWEQNKNKNIIITLPVHLLHETKSINCFSYQINKEFRLQEIPPRTEYLELLKMGI